MSLGLDVENTGFVVADHSHPKRLVGQGCYGLHIFDAAVFDWDSGMFVTISIHIHTDVK